MSQFMFLVGLIAIKNHGCWTDDLSSCLCSSCPVDTKVFLVGELWELQENNLLCKAMMEIWPRITAMYHDPIVFNF